MKNNLITIANVNFNGNFFHSGPYSWPSSLYNAQLVVEEAKNYINLYDLLIHEPFDSNFNLHKSISSLCDTNSDLIEENIGSDTIFNSNFYYLNLTSEEYFKSLNLSTWPYEVVVISAICYLLENILIKYQTKLENFLNPNKFSFFYDQPNYIELIRKDISLDVNLLIRKIAVYLLNNKYSKKLFSVFSNTNIFRIESFATISAFTAIFNDLTKIIKYDFIFKKNNVTSETLCRFFQVFQLNFLFLNLFIENEAEYSIIDSDKPIYSTINLIEILNIYKSFLNLYYNFKNENNERLSKSLETQCSISDQEFFITTFFNYYIDTILDTEVNSLKLNTAIEMFEIIFPSIEINIGKHLQKKKICLP